MGSPPPIPHQSAHIKAPKSGATALELLQHTLRYTLHVAYAARVVVCRESGQRAMRVERYGDDAPDSAPPCHAVVVVLHPHHLQAAAAPPLSYWGMRP